MRFGYFYCETWLVVRLSTRDVSCSTTLLRGDVLQVVPDLLDHGIDAGAGRDHDNVAVGRRRRELPDEEGALQLNRRVVRVLFAPGF